VRGSLVACASAVAAVGAMAVALLAAAPHEAAAPAAADDLPSAFRGAGAVADPVHEAATTPFNVRGGPPTQVLLGGGVDYALLSADGTGQVGRGDVVWHPRGDLDCSPSATPVGATGTDFEIRVESGSPVAGTATGRVDAPAPDCEGAAGSWRGTGGDLAGRDGTLVVSRQDDGLVRVVLGP
jgi:hypothetical protein